MDTDKSKLHDGWRDIDHDFALAFAHIEIRIAEMKKQCDAMSKIIQGHEKLHKIHREKFDRIERYTEKYDETYYHMFPDRLDGDIKLLDQMAALRLKRNPDGDTTKE